MTSELTLRDYFAILRSRVWLIVMCFVGALALALIWSALQTPKYQATARVLINQSASTDLFDPSADAITSSLADRRTTTAVELIESQLVADEAERVLGFPARIVARAPTRADIVELTATDADPVVAQRIAQTFAEAYLAIQRNEFSEGRLATAEDLLEQIAELDAEIEALGPGDESSRKRALRDDYADSYDRLIFSATLGNTGNARVIDEAEVPRKPVSPRTNRNMILGGLMGIVLGGGVALLLESLDTSIKSRQVIEALTPGLPALASIPTMKSDEGVVSIGRPEGVETEVFRTLRAGIQFAAVDRPIQVVQITSAGASAGKTTVAANLAVVMAQSGQRVAVIDCDLRRPRIHTAFGVEQVPGISSVIIGNASGAEASHPLALNNGRLWVFPSGPIPPGPSELLGSERARAAFASLRDQLDVIIIDSPPVLPVSDALVLSRLVDATVVVANARSTKRDDLLRAVEQLDQAGARIVGTVLNQVKANANHGYGYGYGYGGYGYGFGGGKRFGRSSGDAPRIEGTAVIMSDDLPKFDAARASNGSGSGERDHASSIFESLSASWLADSSAKGNKEVTLEDPDDAVADSEKRSKKRRHPKADTAETASTAGKVDASERDGGPKVSKLKADVRNGDQRADSIDEEEEWVDDFDVT